MIQILQQLNFLQHGIAIGSMFVAFQNFDGAVDFVRHLYIVKICCQSFPLYISAKNYNQTYLEYFRKETFANFLEFEVTHVV